MAGRFWLCWVNGVRPIGNGWAPRQREGGYMTKKRAYCKNAVQGRQRGRKYPPKLRAEVVMAMVASNNVCAVARRYKVPESTIRSWLAEEAAKGDAFAEARQAAAREIAVRASIGAKEQVAYLQGRVAESQRAAEIRAKLDKRLEEGVRAGDAEVGALLKTEQEALADAAEVGLVVYNSPGSYDRKLLDNDRRQLEALREHYDGLTMDDKNAANVARVLMDVAEKAAALTPTAKAADETEAAPPMICIGAEGTGDEAEVEVE